MPEINEKINWSLLEKTQFKLRTLTLDEFKYSSDCLAYSDKAGRNLLQFYLLVAEPAIPEAVKMLVEVGFDLNKYS